MEAYDVYRDISERTGGDIYIGVVGPVRTGKSTFITKLMDLLVLPNINDRNDRQRVVDELPQSGAGKTIMTTQPKFVPNEAIEVNIDDKARFKIRMVDCVGYLVEGAIGHIENGQPRMVKTPWYSYEIPFERAAEVGTSKVISEHASVGVVMTTDGTIAGIPRGNYVQAEERVVGELKSLGKPFVIILNSANPKASEAVVLRDELEKKYNSAVLLMDVMNFTKDDVQTVLSDLLYEFPIRQVNLNISSWVCALNQDHWLLSQVLDEIKGSAENMQIMRDYANVTNAFEGKDYIKRVAIDSIELGSGSIEVVVDVKENLFYKVLGEECKTEIADDRHLITIMKDLVDAKNKYKQLEAAMQMVQKEGYGIVAPTLNEMSLEEPEVVQQGNKFGVRLKASAPSLHIIKIGVETEVQPIVGTEQQSEELIDYMMEEFKSDPTAIWKTDIFGKPLSEIVREGLSNKINNVPDDAKEKIQETLERIVNEGDGGMLCILL